MARPMPFPLWHARVDPHPLAAAVRSRGADSDVRALTLNDGGVFGANEGMDFSL